MSDWSEIGALIVCFLFGYVIIDKIFGRKKSQPANAREEQTQSRNNEYSREKADSGEKAKNFSEKDRSPEWHIVLGVSKTSSATEIRKAYLNKMQAYHPDRVANLGEEFQELAERRTKEINAAYQLAQKISQSR